MMGVETGEVSEGGVRGRGEDGTGWKGAVVGRCGWRGWSQRERGGWYGIEGGSGGEL